MYLAAYLEKMGIKVAIEIRDSLEALMPFAPDVLGISSVTENIEFAKEIAGRAKQRWNPITILGGVHLTALPLQLPQEFDIGVIGEGEETLCDLITLIRRSGRPVAAELATIPGIVYHDQGKVKKTPYRKGVNPLDEVPIPAREKFIKKTGLSYMMTSRGCPYTCNFCVIPNTSEGYRTHSPEYVVNEIRTIKRNFPYIKNIRIFDDLYIVDRKRVARIAELVAAEGLNQELSFGCWGRANLIDEEMVKALKKMNMYYVSFGAESGSSRVMSHIKPGASVERNQQAIDLLYDNGLNPTISMLFGHPLETEDDLWASYEFIEKNLSKLLEVEFNVAIPWPGTELWQDAVQSGQVSETMDFRILKECAFFPNYSTDLHPYLNQRIPPERFDLIMADFKKLFWKMTSKLEALGSNEVVLPENEIAQLY